MRWFASENGRSHAGQTQIAVFTIRGLVAPGSQTGSTDIDQVPGAVRTRKILGTLRNTFLRT